jgi:hypothetical protein
LNRLIISNIQNRRVETALTGLKPISLDDIGFLSLTNRIETKYVFPADRVPGLINLLSERYLALEINNVRIFPYTSTYLDTTEALFYNQHVRGEFDRFKIRYRKYESTNTTYLEIKRKTNKGRTIKWRIEKTQAYNPSDTRVTGFIQDHSPVSMNVIKSVLINRFTRITLANPELKERITIDLNVSYSGSEKETEAGFPYMAILELKKEVSSDSLFFRNLIKQLNIYPTSFSKYCVGSALLNDSLKKNMIKPKLLLLKKLENEYTGTDTRW